MAGWVYVLENKSMPGLVKVGYTKHSPKKRAGQLYHTGIPTPFTVYYAGLYEKPKIIEGLAHATLKHCRVNRGREFFKCQPSDAVAAIELHGKPASTKRDISKAEWASFYKSKRSIEANCKVELEIIEVRRQHLNEEVKEIKRNISSSEKELTGGITFSHFAGWFLPSMFLCDSFEREAPAFFIIWFISSLATSGYQKNNIVKSDKYKTLVTSCSNAVRQKEIENTRVIEDQITLVKNRTKQQIQTLKDNLNKS